VTDRDSSPRELPVLIGAGAGGAETLLLIGAPDEGGTVHLRVWTADDWGAPPRPRTERAEELLAWLEAQAKARRTMNQSSYALRLWLRGEGDANR
jgi:hypothetical protein